jgi:hypothetical protein
MKGGSIADIRLIQISSSFHQRGEPFDVSFNGGTAQLFANRVRSIRQVSTEHRTEPKRISK